MPSRKGGNRLRQRNLCRLVAGGVESRLQAAGNVRCLEEHGEDGGRLRRAVADPIPPGLHPSVTLCHEFGIGPGRCQSGGGLALNPALGIGQRGQEGAGGAIALQGLVVAQESVDLTQRLRRIDQRRVAASRRGAAARLAAIRAILSRMCW